MARFDKMLVDRWKRSRLYRALSLGGYVAFDLPRVVTALGALLLVGIVGTHVYVLSTAASPPLYFVVYAAVLIAACLLVAGGLWLGVKPVVPQMSWFLGDLVCTVFLGIYLVTRAVSLPGLVASTGRWDCAPGTLALGLAGAFIGVHMSVLLDINVAYPRQRNWRD